MEQQNCEFHDLSPQGSGADARRHIPGKHQRMNKAWERRIKTVAAHVMDDPTINFPSQCPYASNCRAHAAFTPMCAWIRRPSR
ncbi:hypothetical protein Srot_1203 [Segniliparus rotundus DSM 44985]|uniref:Uncharacterized protein n=1 Tax=Segniliparus rotundus (strain ATCC BAA-972 / CDC 1076 / CIP 108378 / DSM 44985 / JCM 13578) TaxID=640132 RepID=D6ZFF0_SEGRD|nr:hypothetical protein [Segniliparus rotundus]ADG97674.1 hypothetical protein Srot_1203 [Segniliparus rotundus DSM 44985]